MKQPFFPTGLRGTLQRQSQAWRREFGGAGCGLTGERGTDIFPMTAYPGAVGAVDPLRFLEPDGKQVLTAATCIRVSAYKSVYKERDKNGLRRFTRAFEKIGS
jgi:hypothetical protein